MKKDTIQELQDYFDGRGRLNKVKLAMKCYTKDASIFYAYVDGWGKKQYLNIPIEVDDILPIIDKYIGNIDIQIGEVIGGPSEPVKVEIDNLDDLLYKIDGYRESYPTTYTSLSDILTMLADSVRYRLPDGLDALSDYHIPVCSDWEDKLYIFIVRKQERGVFTMHFSEITKI
ncbi:MAG: hypothetical protein NC217_00110 [Muribaculaceae bacterium]|nr:hypothetical protein [Muribaculaceae bacterium]